jgi:hypothetical protein
MSFVVVVVVVVVAIVIDPLATSGAGLGENGWGTIVAEHSIRISQ